MKKTIHNRYRIFYILKFIILVIAGCMTAAFTKDLASLTNHKYVKNSISTDFMSGGGSISPVQSDLNSFIIIPHDEGQAGWSQVWWYFSIDGLTPGTEIELRIEQNEPKCAGISPQAYFSYDQNTWGLTNTGNLEEIDNKLFFVYRHVVRSTKVWFAYDLPYTPENIDEFISSKTMQNPNVEVFELSKTRHNRSVNAFKITDKKSDCAKKYGIWLQARAHAFESGGSWVLHELAKWMLSNDPDAIRLRNCSIITIIPILDVDGVIEGRTGKNQKPYDHNRGWENEQPHWPEIRIVKSMLKDMSDNNMLDLFIDFHGPGGKSHPYFIVPFSHDLPYEKQRVNRRNFFNVLNAKELNDQTKLTQSMTQFHYSPRIFDKTDTSSSSKWVTHKTNEFSLALTLEVNMNTPLSSQMGYQAEAVKLGKSISKYFCSDLHQR